MCALVCGQQARGGEGLVTDAAGEEGVASDLLLILGGVLEAQVPLCRLRVTEGHEALQALGGLENLGYTNNNNNNKQ